MTTKRFIVELDIPDDVSFIRMKDYIQEAVATWKGQLRPPGSLDSMDAGDPLFLLDGDSVKVMGYRRKA